MKHPANGHEIPIGFGMALAQNWEAMQYFAALSPAEQNAIIEETRHAHSKEEMQRYVDFLTRGERF